MGFELGLGEITSDADADAIVNAFRAAHERLSRA
jgi:hypothetical protein